MTISSLDFAITRCEEHLDATKMRSTEIEKYFVEYLLVRICSEYESRVSALVHRRCSRTSDTHLRGFVQYAAEQICKRFSITDICNVLQKFGNDYKHTFHSKVMSGMPHVAWTNIYNNRHAVAHTAGAQMTFGDLKTNYKDSLVVLDAIALALELEPRETLDFH